MRFNLLGGGTVSHCRTDNRLNWRARKGHTMENEGILTDALSSRLSATWEDTTMTIVPG
jgi:hypothetical protein